MIGFNSFLKDKVLCKISRTELIKKLQVKHYLFNGLDEITLSRWINGRTVPSVEKQLIIAKDMNLVDEYLYSIENKEIPKKLESLFKLYWSSIDNSFHAVFHIEKNKKFQFYRDSLLGIQDKLPLIKKLELAYPTKRNLDINFPMEHFVISSLETNEIISHTSIYTSLRKLLLSINTEETIIKEIEEQCNVESSIVHGLTFCASSEDHKLLLGILGNYILEHYFYKKNILAIVRGTIAAGIYEESGASQICCIKNSKDFDNFYLYSIGTTSFLSNPMIFCLIIKYKNFYEQLKTSGAFYWRKTLK
ncbi:hypothetical protein ACSTLL_22020 [Vibrio parahaemolyticus]